MSSIKAAVANKVSDGPYSTRIVEVPKPKVSDSSILIKTVAIAVNQIDYLLLANKVPKDGNIVGCELSGIVDEVGSKFSQVQVGDYVSAFVAGEWYGVEGAFSEFVSVTETAVIKHDKASFKTNALKPGPYEAGPVDSFESAASQNFSLATAAVSFCHELGLEANRDYSDESILIWGGATTVGTIAIQLAKKIYGLKVITTASPGNKDFLTNLGADAVFDYHDQDVIQKIKSYDNNIKYGLDSVGSVPTFQGVYDATGNNAIIDNVYLVSSTALKLDPSRNVEFKRVFVHLAICDSQFQNGDPIKTTLELLDHFRTFWFDVLPKHFDQLITTNLRVLEPGLPSVNTALELFANGEIHAEKIVFRIK